MAAALSDPSADAGAAPGEEGLAYTRREVEGYLPSGWLIAEPEDDGGAGWDDAEWVGRWDAEAEAWTLPILDGADVEWAVTVDRSGVAKHGRMGALRAAVDDAYRGRLGRPTRGLGISRGLRGLFSR